MKAKSNKEPLMFSYLNFFAGMSSYLFDTYLFVIIAVSEISKYGKQVKENNLIDELHVAIREMYSDNQISQLGSCLKEVIATAIGKYITLGLLKAAIFPG
jgi:hypothetical protein